MNSLSWFLYLADVFYAFGPLFGITAFLSLCVWVGCWVFVSFYNHDYPHTKKTPPSKWLLSVPIVCAAMSALIPSKSTMYAIAASEMGEKALNTEIVGDAQKALHQWIKKQIEPKKD